MCGSCVENVTRRHVGQRHGGVVGEIGVPNSSSAIPCLLSLSPSPSPSPSLLLTYARPLLAVVSGPASAMSGLDSHKHSLDSQSSNDSATLAYTAFDSDHDHPRSALLNGTHPSSTRPEFLGTDRSALPTRAATLDSPHDRDQRPPRMDDRPHARSEDLNHSSAAWGANDAQTFDRGLSQSPAPPFRGGSRPGTPGSSSNHHHPPSSSDHSERPPSRARSVHSDSSLNSDPPTPGGSQRGGASTTTHTSSSVAST